MSASVKNTNAQQFSMTKSPSKLSDKVTTQVRNDIVTCVLAPNTKLKISDLSEKYEVSLGGVREALSSLAAEGFVIALPQKGFIVAPVSMDELRDLTDARVEIEKMCLDIAIRHGGLDWESNVVAARYRLMSINQYEESGNVRVLSESWSQAHEAFHQTLVSGCPNQVLLDIRANLYRKSERYRRLSVPLNKKTRDVAGEHQAIADAALAKDSGLACRLLEEHLRATTLILIEAESTEKVDA